MIESKSFEVELKDAEPDIIEQLVEFAYTARYCFLLYVCVCIGYIDL